MSEFSEQLKKSRIKDHELSELRAVYDSLPETMQQQVKSDYQDNLDRINSELAGVRARVVKEDQYWSQES